MRWTRNDTEAYNVVSTAGKGLLTAMERARLGEAYRNGTEVTGPQSEDMIKAYQQEEAQQRRAIDENNAYTPGTAEGNAAEAQNAQAARVAGLYGQAATDNSKYRVGSQMYEAAPTWLQKHRGGLERQMEYLASRGDAEEAAKLQERISGLDTVALQQEALRAQNANAPLVRKGLEQKVAVGDQEVAAGARRAVRETAADKLDALVRDAGSLSDDDFLGKAAEFASNGVDDGKGFTFRKDPETGQVFLQQHDRKTRAVTGEIPWDGDRSKLIEHLTRYSSAESFTAARKEDRLALDRKTTRDDLRTHQQQIYELQVKHFDAQAAQSERTYKLAKQSADLMAERHGRNSPEYKLANIKLAQEEGWQKGLADLSKLMESGAPPEKVNALAEQLARDSGHDKMVKTQVKDVDGTVRDVLVSPLLDRVKSYAATWRDAETKRKAKEGGGAMASYGAAPAAPGGPVATGLGGARLDPAVLSSSGAYVAGSPKPAYTIGDSALTGVADAVAGTVEQMGINTDVRRKEYLIGQMNSRRPLTAQELSDARALGLTR